MSISKVWLVKFRFRWYRYSGSICDFWRGKLRPGPNSIKSKQFVQVFHSYQPNAVFLQIGRKDLFWEENLEKIARDIRSFAESLLVAHSVSHVIVGQLRSRYSNSLQCQCHRWKRRCSRGKTISPSGNIEYYGKILSPY